MPVPAIDADKRGDAYKKVKPVEGIDEQGLVPDPQVMHVLFARLMAILGPLGILPIIFAVNSVTTARRSSCWRKDGLMSYQQSKQGQKPPLSTARVDRTSGAGSAA